MNDFEKVAKWITEECDDPQDEVKRLLTMLYEGKKPKLTFEEAYENVLDLMEWEETLGFKLH